MIIALYQCEDPGSVARGLAVVDEALSRAAAMGVDLLVMPEAFLPGYLCAPATPPEGWDSVTPRLSALCQSHGVALVIGLPDYTATGVYNTALALDAQGARLASYRKRQLFGPDEQALFTPGSDYVTFDYHGTRFGLLICYDIEFPEHARALARLGVDAILVPTANHLPFTNVSQFMVPARAAENAVTVLYANYCGSVGDHAYCGLSTIAGPDGFSLGTMAHGTGLCLAELPKPGWSEHGVPLATQLADLITP